MLHLLCLMFWDVHPPDISRDRNVPGGLGGGGGGGA